MYATFPDLLGRVGMGTRLVAGRELILGSVGLVPIRRSLGVSDLFP